MFRLLFVFFRVKDILFSLIRIIELENKEEVRWRGIKSYYSLFYIKKLIVSPIRLYKVLVGKELNIRFAEITLTTICSLKCKGCGALMDFYPATLSHHYEEKEILAQLNSLVNAVDSIYWLRLLGGEPLCYPHLYEVLSVINNEDKIKYCEILTNGTLLIKDERISEILKNKKFFISISNYGATSMKKDELIMQFDANKIRYQVLQMEKWIDFGDLTIRNYNHTKLKKMFYFCRCKSRVSCKTILHGRMFMCSRNSHGANLGKIPLKEKDYVDLLDNTVSPQEMKKRLFKFLYGYIPYVEGCKYCSHVRHCKSIPVAEQLSVNDRQIYV